MTEEKRSVCIYRTSLGPTSLSTRAIEAFTTYVTDERKLALTGVARLMERIPFFLIAATGLGKTLIVPLSVLNYMMSKWPAKGTQDLGPRIWVVEPKIAIAQSLASEMNRNWSEFGRKIGVKKDDGSFQLFGCKTKVDHLNPEAPIMFITTGIFSIYARKGMFRPEKDFILVDEAHVTLETDEAFELGVGICRSRNVPLSYMSASVDSAGISERLGATVFQVQANRFPVWKHNLGCSLDDGFISLVERTLIAPNPDDDVFPKADATWASTRKSVFEQGRAKGMLVIVNSFSSKESDAKRLERDLKQAPFADKIRIGLLAGEVLRDPERRSQYENSLRRWKQEKARYVLIATSVVEMGVTLPDLDFVVTMDSALQEVENGVRLGALGTNALIQRIGRVGRERPGIAYISREVGADYTSLSDDELNAPEALKPEPIHWPIEKGNFDWLAHHSLQEGWDPSELDARVNALRLPSRLGSEEISRLERARSKFQQAGLATSRSLTLQGTEIENWLGFRPLPELSRLRMLVRAYDAHGFFGTVLGCVAQELKEQATEYDDYGYPENEDEFYGERLSLTFSSGVNALILGASDSYGSRRTWERFEESLFEADGGNDLVVKTMRLVARVLDEAVVHIEQEFKRDRFADKQSFQKRFWKELRFYQALLRQLTV